MRIYDIIKGVNNYLESKESQNFILSRELLEPHKTIKMFKILTVEIYLRNSLGNSKLGEIKVTKKVLNNDTEEIYKAASSELIAWLIENKDLYTKDGTE